MKTLLAPPSLDDFSRLLRAWRFWLISALVGGLLGSGYFFINPPEFRARATVVVSFNMEKAWQDKPDNQLFYYLDRESRKVSEIAWSDATLQQVSDKAGLTVSTLRTGKLELSQPQDGGWHFYANDPSAEKAGALAAAWASAFTQQTQQAIQTEVNLDAARKALAATPGDVSLQTSVQQLEAKSLAITPELQISLAQEKDLPVERKSSMGNYILAGAALFWAIAGLAVLLTGAGKRD